ncbi:MAG: hypothetical protein CML24_14535 [Rhizobiales bacterium]|nr:hypothetical protein [Hyphomicrobiales bacterium]|tara:strand:+ start:2472 stop:3413 length:942 start_codon:yes stop_codon:yes gene_type:complete
MTKSTIRGRAFYQPVRTITVPTFLRFFMILHEHRERFAAAWPVQAVLDADFPVRAATSLNQKELDQVLREYDDAFEFHRHFAASWLGSAGVPEHVIDTPAVDEFLRYQAAQAIRADVLAKPPRKYRGSFEPENPDFTFDRQIAQRGIVGTFVSLGKGDRTATAHFLNRGLPNGKRGVNYSQVRNALDGFVRVLRRSVGSDGDRWVDRWEVISRWPDFEVRVADAMWRKLGGVPGKNGQAAEQALLALIETGEVHQEYAETAERVGFPKYDAARVLPLIEHKIGQLKNAQKRMGRIAKSGGVLSAGNATHLASR